LSVCDKKISSVVKVCHLEFFAISRFFHNRRNSLGCHAIAPDITQTQSWSLKAKEIYSAESNIYTDYFHNFFS
jgi:hypothetical protein